ncbi:hypothetical protein [Nocardioides euryhalodurans]|uniref:Uncharacterized protein n=1 Tax=Nocardioides euryhalodurans TaxID=2518370 RepID=A0A4P7GL07_9ACTN|nr:hypothetical protein [Nocardioides euryhalodurans]QBR92765.1 hypothetical protein EXE57_11140 [Nocardioides euryhalodurans]
MPKPGGRLATGTTEYGTNRVPRKVGRTRRPDLVAECRRRGIDLSAEEEAYLRSRFWSPRTARELISVIQGCENAGVPFTMSFTHQDGQPVELLEVEIKMTGH